MRTVAEILVDVRDALADTGKTRWDDATLLRHYNKGAYDIAKRAEMFKGNTAIALRKGQYVYELPDDFLTVKGVLYNQEPLPVYTAQQMERIYGNDWRTHSTTSRIQAIVMDRQDIRKLRVYPRPFSDTLSEDYTFAPDTFGVTTGLTDYQLDSLFGVVASIYDEDILDQNQEDFGVIVDGFEFDGIVIEYVRHPSPKTSINDVSEFPDVYDSLLVKFITGTAFRNDVDQQNRAIGNEELTLYKIDLDNMHGNMAKSQSSSAITARSEYRGMG